MGGWSCHFVYVASISPLQGLSAMPDSRRTLASCLSALILISPIELFEAFDFPAVDDVIPFLRPLVNEGYIAVRHVPHGVFIIKK